MIYFNKDIPDMMINLIDKNYILKKTPKSNFSEDIFFLLANRLVYLRQLINFTKLEEKISEL